MTDPLTEWDGPFPYDVFADLGISPESTHTEVQNVSFELLKQNRFTHEARVAWDELRHVDRRLFVDLFVYPGVTDESRGDHGQH